MNYRWDRPGTIHHMLRTQHGNLNIDVHACEGDTSWDVRLHIDEDKSKNLHFDLIPIYHFDKDEATWVAKRMAYYCTVTEIDQLSRLSTHQDSMPTIQCEYCKTHLRVDRNPAQRTEFYTCTACLILHESEKLPTRNGWTFEQTVAHEDLLSEIVYLEYAISCLKREYHAIVQDTQEYTKLLEEQSMLIVDQNFAESNEQFLACQRMVSAQNRYCMKVSDELKKKTRKLKRSKKELARLSKVWSSKSA